MIWYTGSEKNENHQLIASIQQSWTAWPRHQEKIGKFISFGIQKQCRELCRLHFFLGSNILSLLQPTVNHELINNHFLRLCSNWTDKDDMADFHCWESGKMRPRRYRPVAAANGSTGERLSPSFHCYPIRTELVIKKMVSKFISLT